MKFGPQSKRFFLPFFQAAGAIFASKTSHMLTRKFTDYMYNYRDARRAQIDGPRDDRQMRQRQTP